MRCHLMQLTALFSRCYKSCTSAEGGVGKSTKTHVDAFTVPSVIEDFFEPLIGHARAARLSRDERTNRRSERLDSESPAAAVASPKHFWVKRQVSHEIECFEIERKHLEDLKVLVEQVLLGVQGVEKTLQRKRLLREELGRGETSLPKKLASAPTFTFIFPSTLTHPPNVGGFTLALVALSPPAMGMFFVRLAEADPSRLSVSAAFVSSASETCASALPPRAEMPRSSDGMRCAVTFPVALTSGAALIVSAVSPRHQ